MNSVYYSKKSALLCTSGDGVQFKIINGAWKGTLSNGKMIVNERPDTIVDVSDLEKMTRDEFDDRYPDFGY